MVFFHHSLSDQHLTSTARNAYFASGFKQSLGYAYGIWSASLSASLEISFLTLILLGLGGVASPLACQTIIAMGIPWSHFYLGSLVLSAFNVAFLVITFQPTKTEFLSDRENALTVINRLAKKQDAYMEAMSPISKSESDVGDMNDEGKRNNSMHYIILFIRLIDSLVDYSPSPRAVFSVSVGCFHICVNILWMVFIPSPAP